MGKRATQQYPLTAIELKHLADAKMALEVMRAPDRCELIQHAGSSPAIYYSIHHGFPVLDLTEEDEREIDEVLKPHALPFSSRPVEEISG